LESPKTNKPALCIPRVRSLHENEEIPANGMRIRTYMLAGGLHPWGSMASRGWQLRARR
jgi:hypothetical protein